MTRIVGVIMTVSVVLIITTVLLHITLPRLTGIVVEDILAIGIGQGCALPLRITQGVDHMLLLTGRAIIDLTGEIITISAGDLLTLEVRRMGLEGMRVAWCSLPSYRKESLIINNKGLRILGQPSEPVLGKERIRVSL